MKKYFVVLGFLCIFSFSVCSKRILENNLFILEYPTFQQSAVKKLAKAKRKLEFAMGQIYKCKEQQFKEKIMKCKEKSMRGVFKQGCMSYKKRSKKTAFWGRKKGCR